MPKNNKINLIKEEVKVIEPARVGFAFSEPLSPEGEKELDLIKKSLKLSKHSHVLAKPKD